MANFRPLKEHELSSLSDQQLIDYVGAARDADKLDDAQTALGVLVFRHYANVRGRVRMKIPADDVEDIAMEAVTSAIRSAFDGTSRGEFHGWLHKIVSRRIADYHGKNTIDTTPLPEEHGDDESVWGVSGIEPDPTTAVDVESVIEQALGELSEPHRLVIQKYAFEDLSAADAAAAVNSELPDLNPVMSEQNVNQIVSRFRKRVRELLAEADRT